MVPARGHEIQNGTVFNCFCYVAGRCYWLRGRQAEILPDTLPLRDQVLQGGTELIFSEECQPLAVLWAPEKPQQQTFASEL